MSLVVSPLSTERTASAGMACLRAAACYTRSQAALTGRAAAGSFGS